MKILKNFIPDQRSKEKKNYKFYQNEVKPESLKKNFPMTSLTFHQQKTEWRFVDSYKCQAPLTKSVFVRKVLEYFFYDMHQMAYSKNFSGLPCLFTIFRIGNTFLLLTHVLHILTMKF